MSLAKGAVSFELAFTLPATARFGLLEEPLSLGDGVPAFRLLSFIKAKVLAAPSGMPPGIIGWAAAKMPSPICPLLCGENGLLAMLTAWSALKFVLFGVIDGLTLLPSWFLF